MTAAIPPPAPRWAQTWLVVGAHPDDDSMASALLATERNPGDRVVILIMRLVGLGRPSDRPSWTAAEAIASRAGHMARAAATLQAELRWWLPPAPGNPEIAATPDTVAKMAGLLREIAPDRIVTHWGDEHPDHAGTAALVLAALRELDVPERIRLYRAGHPEHALPVDFHPNHFVDISNPTVLATVLWGRLVHRSLTSLEKPQRYLRQFHEYGKLAGVDYAVPYLVQRIPRAAVAEGRP
jgi:LmbE family N-acetylglucosaminyl deacetylase